MDLGITTTLSPIPLWYLRKVLEEGFAAALALHNPEAISGHSLVESPEAGLKWNSQIHPGNQVE